VLHWHEENGLPVLEPADLSARVAASLRALRRARALSQHDLAKIAGVTASAISQAERGERGLSLATLVRLSSSLGLTVDDLLHGEDPEVYRIGRRSDDAQGGSERVVTLFGDPSSELRVDLVHLGPREAGRPAHQQTGRGIVLVAIGLVQVHIASQTPAIRSGEVLVAASDRVEAWRNIGQTEALFFWVVVATAGGSRLA
jgi:transcriptional regulator with XRE-family HTH domain